MFWFRQRKRYASDELEIDEVLLDAANLPEFNTGRIEGRVVRPISKFSAYLLGSLFVLIAILFLGRIGYLQIAHGEEFAQRSEDNRLSRSLIFSERGVITDRSGKELAWNEPNEGAPFARRAYINVPGYAHVLGYVTYPKADASGVFYQTEFEGKAGVERSYAATLNGMSGEKIIETDALFNIQSENILVPPKDGKNVALSIDGRVQEQLYHLIRSVAQERGFEGGAGVIMDVRTGELIALVSYPEYDPNVLTDGSDHEAIQRYVTDPKKPFLNRAVSGLYTPGSIVKPFMAVAALEEGVISPSKQILSTGKITLQSPYDPDVVSVFTDWKAHGWVDMQRALAMSSNVYFYEIGGGYKGQQGIGIANIEKYARLFGIGETTGVDIPGEKEGVIPNPAWKAKHFNGEPWRIGDTYHTVIGQYGFQVTPIQMVRAVAALANDGVLVTPRINLNTTAPQKDLPVSPSALQVVRGGMRKAVTEGTAKGLNVSYVPVAAKTGTAEVGVGKKYVNSWVMGFFPYDNPKYAFTVVLEHGPRHNLIGGVYVMRQLLDWLHTHAPEYLE